MMTDSKGRSEPPPCPHGTGYGLEDMTQDGKERAWILDCNMCLHRGMSLIDPRDTIHDRIRIRIEDELPPNPPPYYLYLCKPCGATFRHTGELREHQYRMGRHGNQD